MFLCLPWGAGAGKVAEWSLLGGYHLLGALLLVFLRFQVIWVDGEQVFLEYRSSLCHSCSIKNPQRVQLGIFFITSSSVHSNPLYMGCALGQLAAAHTASCGVTETPAASFMISNSLKELGWDRYAIFLFTGTSYQFSTFHTGHLT